MTYPVLVSWLQQVDDDLDYDDDAFPDDEDVKAERERVLGGEADRDVVCLKRLRKVYPTGSNSPVRFILRILKFLFSKFWSKVIASKKVNNEYGSMDAIAPLLDNSTKPQREMDSIENHPCLNNARNRNQRLEAQMGSKQTKSKVAVHDLSFGIPRGECFGFLGKNENELFEYQIFLAILN